MCVNMTIQENYKYLISTQLDLFSFMEMVINFALLPVWYWYDD